MASKFANVQFWTDAVDRAVATAAQAAIATFTAGATGLLDIDWAEAGSVVGLAGVVSLLTSVAFRGNGEEEPYAEENTFDEPLQG